MQEDVIGCKESAMEEEKWHLEGRRGWKDRMGGGSRGILPRQDSLVLDLQGCVGT